MRKEIICICFVLALSFQGTGQETFPVYADYLSDNVYLVHPAAAGIGNCGKLRFTYRKQWAGLQESPALQTISFHTRITEKMALGAIIFNDENGYHTQKGFTGTYAYHLNFGRDDALNQLSFGLSFMYVQNAVDQSGFTSDITDPIISQIVESANYFNADISLGYHYMDYFGYLTVKNLLLSARDQVNSDFESLNLRRYLLTLGYYFNRGRGIQLEPSVMLQVIERTGEVFTDLNLKVYKDLSNKAQIWAALSYRRNFDSFDSEHFSQISPIIGVNYKKFMFAYTYSAQMGDVVLDQGGHHQFTIGWNVLCGKPRATGCPNLNSIF